MAQPRQYVDAAARVAAARRRVVERGGTEIKVALDANLHATLKALAERQGIPATEAVRRAILIAASLP